MDKKIAIFHYSLNIGGAEKMIAFLANSLSEQYKVYLVLLENRPGTMNIKKEVEIHQLNLRADRALLEMPFIERIQEIRTMVASIEDECDKIKPQMVIAFDDRITLLTWLACSRKKKYKLVYSQRNDPYDKPLRWKMITFWIYKKCDGVVFQTRQVETFYRLTDSERSCIIPNPAIQRSSDDKGKQGSRKGKYIFSAGRFQYRKGFDVLIKAFQIVHEKYQEYGLFIYGDGDEREQLENCVKNCGLTDCVRMPGAVEDVIAECLDASMFVLPSRSEGIPNILIEAMIAGIPCIASDCSPGGARLLLEDGRCGTIVPVDDENALAKAMIEYIDNEKIVLQKVENAYEYISRFRPEEIRRKWLFFLERIFRRNS